MDEMIVHNPPISITDLKALKLKGAAITVNSTFEINEVDLVHEENPFRAFLFFSHFSGTVDGKPYEFRKCYAKGCQHNLCPHVSQAVMIANRYLKRDFTTLRKAGIAVEESFFTLENMLAQFEEKRDDFVVTLILEDYIRIAEEGDNIAIDVSVEKFPAVENFINHSEKRMFFSANFNVDYLEETHVCQRCFSCYVMEREKEEAKVPMDLANRRLANIYQEFKKANIDFNEVFFQ